MVLEVLLAISCSFCKLDISLVIRVTTSSKSDILLSVEFIMSDRVNKNKKGKRRYKRKKVNFKRRSDKMKVY